MRYGFRAGSRFGVCPEFSGEVAFKTAEYKSTTCATEHVVSTNRAIAAQDGPVILELAVCGADYRTGNAVA